MENTCRSCTRMNFLESSMVVWKGHRNCQYNIFWFQAEKKHPNPIQTPSIPPFIDVIWYLGYHLAYQYMVTKKQYISPGGFPLINFQALSRSLTSASPLYWLWYSKFVSGHLATGQIMCLWGKWDMAQCPCCHHDHETMQHVVICPDPCMWLILYSQLQLFEQWLMSVETMPDIQFCLIQSLWMEQESLFSPFVSPLTQVTAQAQDQIGWANLLLGQLAVAWSTLQHAHLISIV